MAESFSSSFVTKANTDKVIKSWTVENFSLLPPEKTVETPEFSCGSANGFWLQITPGAKEVKAEPAPAGAAAHDPREYVSLYLDRRDGRSPVMTMAKVTVANHAGREPFVRQFNSSHPLPHPGFNGWGWGKLLLRNTVLDPALGWLSNDRLELSVEVSVISDATTSASGSRKGAESKITLEALSEDLEALLAQPDHSDVTLFVDGAEFQLHKNILAARSPVFKAMFAHDMKESQDGVVEIQDVKAPVFKQLLKFLYTGECLFKDEKYGKSRGESKEAKQEEVLDMAAHLLAAADRFQVPLLTGMAIDALIENVTVENVADRLLMADACHAPDLKARCIDFLRADPRRLSEMAGTDGYKKLNPGHFQDLLSALAPPAPASSNNSNNNSKKRKREDDLTPEAVKKMKVTELKAALAERGLDSSGLKSELIDRLENALK